MKEFEFKKIQVRNEVLAYREGGIGERVLVLIHGNMSSSLHFDHLMDALYNDFRIFAVDMRGFGHSSYHERFNSLKDLSEDIEFFVDKLRLKDIEVVGWSTGGGVAMQFACDNPDLVKRLVLLESVGIKGYPMFKRDSNGAPLLDQLLMTKEEIEQDPIQVAPVLRALESGDAKFYKMLWNMAIYTAGNTPDEEDYDRYISEMLLQRNLVDVDYALTRFNLSSEHNGYSQGMNEISKIKCPVVIVQGDKDLVVPMAMAEGIFDALKPDAKLEILENSAHNPLVDRLDKVVELIKGN